MPGFMHKRMVDRNRVTRRPRAFTKTAGKAVARSALLLLFFLGLCLAALRVDFRRPIDENRNAGMRQDPVSFATQQQRGKPAATVLGHEDEIAVVVVGRVDDRLPRRLADDRDRGAIDAGVLAQLLDEPEVLLAFPFGPAARRSSASGSIRLP